MLVIATQETFCFDNVCVDEAISKLDHITSEVINSIVGMISGSFITSIAFTDGFFTSVTNVKKVITRVPDVEDVVTGVAQPEHAELLLQGHVRHVVRARAGVLATCLVVHVQQRLVLVDQRPVLAVQPGDQLLAALLEM